MSHYPLWPQVEEAWRDTLVHKAERRALRELAPLYGYDWPAYEASERAWRGSLWAVAYARRGTFPVTRDAVEAALSDYNRPLTARVNAADRLVLHLDDPDEADDVSWTQSLVRTDYGLFFVERVVGTFDDTELHVYDMANPYWDTPAWPFEGVRNIEIEQLPFTIRERTPGLIDDLDQASVGRPCLVEVILRQGSISAVPPSYLMDNEGAPSGSVPYGSQLLANETVDGNPDGSGPYPLYLYDGASFPGVRKQVKRTLAGGVHLKVGWDPMP